MSGRRSPLLRTVGGLGSMVLGTVVLMGALPGSAGADDGQQTPSTTEVDDNATCAGLAPEGANWVELKVEPVADGTDTDGTLSVTIDVTETADGPVFDWTSNIGVDAVFVKGGPGGLLYVYDPPTESTGDTGLHAPVNPANGMYYGLSHLSFCYDEDETTTTVKDTTTSLDETTTTEKHEDTTTTTEKHEETTTTVADEETTTTTVKGDEATTTTVKPTGELPRTGSTTFPLVAVGALLLATGFGLLVTTRLRRS
ncbi:MAG TPA: LPXTG cell wall anchor domain-containing protein [Acidimicrobiales bacterium]